MTLFKRLFAKPAPKTRVRICVECGKPVAEHMEWCAIRRGEIEMKLKAGASPSHGA